MDHDPLQPIIISNQRRRRRARRRLQIGSWVWRAGVAAIVLGLSGGVITRAFQPYAMRYRQVRETRSLLEELAAAKTQNQDLLRQIQMLRSGQGLELEARKLGYIRKGEVPLQITFEPPRGKTE